MKTTLTLMTLLFLGISNLNAHHAPLKRVEVPAEHLYAPKGFDSNDNVELVVEGYLPNLCYQNPSTNVVVEEKKISVTLNAMKFTDESRLCAEMIVPFIHTFDVGVLDRGNYSVVVNEKVTGELFVDEASSDAIDDYIYANVHSIDRIHGEEKVLVKGYHPSDCLEFVGFEYLHNDLDTYSVLPIMEQVADFCPRKKTPFSYEFTVPRELKRDKVLLHVRALNGRSVNAIFNY